MSGSFSGLEIGRRALMASRWATEVIGHNVANANTEGYTRQEVHLTALPPAARATLYESVHAQPGGGVTVDMIRRFRDQFLDAQLRSATGDSGRWDVAARSTARIENALGEPSENSLSAHLDRFFNAWQDVANDAQGSAPRSSLISMAQSLATRFNHLAAALNGERANLNNLVVTRANEVNDYATQLASLNGQISTAQSAGNSTADLRDRRDLLLDKLSQVVPISYTEDAGGNVDVSIGGRPLVDNQTKFAIQTALVSGVAQVQWTADSAPVAITGGELMGAIGMRDTTIPAMLVQIDVLAANLVTQVNTLHAAGYGLDGGTGRNFLQGGSAASIAVVASVVADPRQVAAASAPGAVGDGSNALALGNLADALTMGGGNTTFNGFWTSFVTQAGVDTRQAAGLSDGYGLVRDQVNDSRSALGGVSIDEEAANLVKFQHTYEAAARLVSVVDEMLNTIINGMGAGR